MNSQSANTRHVLTPSVSSLSSPPPSFASSSQAFSSLSSSSTPASPTTPPSGTIFAVRTPSEEILWAQLGYIANGPSSGMSALISTHGARETWDRLIHLSQQESEHNSCEHLASLVISALHKSVSEDTSHSSAASRPSTVSRSSAQLRANVVATAHTWYRRLLELLSFPADVLAMRLSANKRLHILYPAHPCWPAEKLERLLLPSCSSVMPICLWVEGDASLLIEPHISGIVGSRQMSDYGKRCTQEVTRACYNAGSVVITGGAFGVDAQANATALSMNQPSIAMMAGGLANPAPSANKPLFSEIVSTGGALVSEVPPYSVPFSSRFLERNRIIAALSDVLIVAQARYRSGALNTARWAEEMYRPVLAIPGNIDEPSNAGCNRLLRSQKATIVTDISDLSDFLSPTLSLNLSEPNPDAPTSEHAASRTDKHAPEPLSLEEEILHLTARQGKTVDELVNKLQPRYPAREVSQSMGLLEAQGHLIRLPTGKFVHAQHP